MSKRAEAETLWLRVVAGEFDDPAVRTWLVAVAEKLLLADDEPDDNVRRAGYGKAVGLTGRKRPKRDPIERYTPLMGFGRDDSMTDKEWDEHVLRNFAASEGKEGYLANQKGTLHVAKTRAKQAYEKARSLEQEPDGGDFDPERQ